MILFIFFLAVLTLGLVQGEAQGEARGQTQGEAQGEAQCEAQGQTNAKDKDKGPEVINIPFTVLPIDPLSQDTDPMVEPDSSSDLSSDSDSDDNFYNTNFPWDVNTDDTTTILPRKPIPFPLPDEINHNRIMTRMFTNEDDRLYRQISKYIAQTYPAHIRSQHVISLADLDFNNNMCGGIGNGIGKGILPGGCVVPPSTDDKKGSSDVILIAPGCYEVYIDYFKPALLKIEVTESIPVGLETRFAVYRTLKITGYSRDLDLLIFRARKSSEKDESDSIRVYQSTTWGDWDSGTISGFLSLKKRNIDTIFLDTGVTANLLNDLRQFLLRKEVYRKHGIPYHRNYLLTGPPGTGKTSLIHALASSMNMGLAVINFNMYYGKQSLARNLASLPKRCMIVVEDIDSLYEQRSSDDRRNGLTFSDFINAIDGFTSSNDGTILFMTSNHPDKLDPAILRPGRVDVRVELGYATKNQVRDIFMAYYLAKDFDKEELFLWYQNHRSSCFEKFYAKMVELGVDTRMTTASLQNFFFRHLDDMETEEGFNKVMSENMSELLTYVQAIPEPGPVSNSTEVIA